MRKAFLMLKTVQTFHFLKHLLEINFDKILTFQPEVIQMINIKRRTIYELKRNYVI